MRQSFLLLLLLLGCWICATAFRLDKSERCICKESYKVHPSNIFKWSLYHPSASCGAYEIVVTTKAGKKICLHPDTKAWKFIMRGWR